MASYNVRRNPASLVLVMWLEEQTAITLEAWLTNDFPMFLFAVHISCNSSGL
ncbi:hypothetical protein MKW92_038972 [Papaver armeniacum]|nr:hypothetical protein MKW92_038972 [Papaver armeniacum]